MSEPRDSSGVKIDVLRSLKIDFFGGIVELEDADGSTHRYQIVRDSVVSIAPNAQQDVPMAMHDSVPSPGQQVIAPGAATPSSGESGAQKTVRVVARIKGAPRPGRPDGKGRPTAWCKLATHEEGRDSARMLSCTFHAGTANKALTLADGSQIVVEGYVRESDDPKRMNSLSVFKIVTIIEPEE